VGSPTTNIVTDQTRKFRFIAPSLVPRLSREGYSPRMSTRWRIAGFVLAAIAFIGVLLRPGNFLSVPPIVEAAVVAVSVFIVVWLYEGIFIAARWAWRKIAS
jgi:hypothetical protein